MKALPTFTEDMLFDPYSVEITHHAFERYCERRKTRRPYANDAIRRLLGKAALSCLPPVKYTKQYPKGSRRFHVSGFVLILSPDCQALKTIWRSEA